MTTFERFMILFILILFFSISVAVIGTVYGGVDRVKEIVKERKMRPAACQVYYNDGTDNWKNCMGVGYK